IEVMVPESVFPRISRQQDAVISFDWLPGRTFESPVSIRIPSGDTSTRTFPVRMELDNSELLLAPGMFARVELPLDAVGESGPSILVPKDAVVMSPDRTETVWVVTNGGEGLVVESRTIRTGRTWNDLVEIREGELT